MEPFERCRGETSPGEGGRRGDSASTERRGEPSPFVVVDVARLGETSPPEAVAVRVLDAPVGARDGETGGVRLRILDNEPDNVLERGETRAFAVDVEEGVAVTVLKGSTGLDTEKSARSLES